MTVGSRNVLTVRSPDEESRAVFIKKNEHWEYDPDASEKSVTLSSPTVRKTASGVTVVVTSGEPFPADAPADLKEVYSQAEKGIASGVEAIRNKEVEFGAVYSKNGNLIAISKGDASQTELPQTKGAIMIHNHTENVTFSIGDVREMIKNEGEAQILATPEATFRLTKNHEGVKLSMEELDKRLNNLPLGTLKILNMKNNSSVIIGLQKKIYHSMWGRIFDGTEYTYENDAL